MARHKALIAVLGLFAMFGAIACTKGGQNAVAPNAVSTPVITTTIGYNWLQFNFDQVHSGNNTLETAISRENVGNLSRLFQVDLGSIADSAPVYLAGANTPSGTRDLLFVTTKAGDILALDAHTGAQLWVQHNPAVGCTVNNGGGVPCFTTSSPAIDPNLQYVYSYGLDGFVHKYNVGDGIEVTDGGWPELVTLKPYDEKGSSALTFATTWDGETYLFMVTSGYLGDGGEYQGHLTAINLADGSQNVFNTLCSDQTVHFQPYPKAPSCDDVQSGIWARPGAIYDPSLDLIFIVTGNGDFDPSRHDWGDSVLALNPDGTGINGGPIDSYTPSEYQQLQTGDLDLGGSAPVLLPAPGNGNISHLALEVGKDSMLRLISLDDLSGQGGPGFLGGTVADLISLPQDGVVRTQPAVWVNPADNLTWVFIGDDNGISGFRLDIAGEGNPDLQPMWLNWSGGTSPIIANGVLYYASSSGIQALDPISGKLLWQDSTMTAFHWESPIVANGVLYVTDENGRLTSFGLPPTSQ